MKATIKVERFFKGDTYTIGNLYVNGEKWCNTLEDRVRDLSVEKKIPGETAIPAGNYKVILNESPRFRRVLPRLLDVPYFDGILIHRGNTDKDTSGCILVGENTVKGKVVNSTYWENKLIEYLKGFDEISITVV